MASLSDAKTREEAIQYLVYIDAPCDFTHGPGRKANVLGCKLDPVGAKRQKRTAQGVAGSLDGPAVALTRDHGIPFAQELLGQVADPVKKVRQTFARSRRDDQIKIGGSALSHIP